MKVRTVRQALAHVLGPLRLTRSQAVGAMTITTGAGIPFPMPAVGAFGVVVAERSMAAVRDEVELRVILLIEPAGPKVAPLA